MPSAAKLAAVGRDLLEFASSRVDSGQRQLAHHIKLQLSASGSRCAERLDYAEDLPFLSPSLFAFFSASSPPAATLDQIIYGSLPAEQRPAEIEAYVDRLGNIDLPGLGQLVGSAPDRIVSVAPATSMAHDGGAVNGVSFVEAARIPGTGLGYATRPGPLFAPICQSACPGSDLGDAASGTDFSNAISRALEVIRELDRELHRCLLATTRQIVTFESEDGESFATLSAHGAVFLRPPRRSDEVFFIEDLAHQCGHLLFNAITLDRGELIEIDPDTPLKDLTGDAEEERSLYIALHGVFTECVMSMVLAGALRTDCFDARQSHELKGRLSLIMKRLHLDLGQIGDRGSFTPTGRELLDAFGKVFDAIYGSVGAEITGCDLRNQPYSFCYELFTQLNPLHPHGALDDEWNSAPDLSNS